MIIYLAGSIADKCASDPRLDQYEFGTLHTFYDRAPKEVLKFEFKKEAAQPSRRTKWPKERKED